MTEPRRVAVQLGGETLRIATRRAGAEPDLVELPATGDPGELGAALDALLAKRPDRIVVVHPADLEAAQRERLIAVAAARARRTTAVAAPTLLGGPGRIVLDIGLRGAELTLLDASGGVRRGTRIPVGGLALDAALADLHAHRHPGPVSVRAVREGLSLRPEVAGVRSATATPALVAALEPVRAALAELAATAAEPVEVVLAGGVARTPLLAAVVEQTPGVAGVRVARGPESAAVWAAAQHPAPGSDPQAVVADPAADGPRRLLPVPTRRRGPALLVAAAVLLAAAGAGTGTRSASTAATDPLADTVVAQYGYRFELPAGWAHTGGDPARRRVLLTPADAPAGSDLVAVERTPLGYDTTAERDRAGSEVAAAFRRAAAAGESVTSYTADVERAGRSVATYRQRGPGSVRVEWVVLLDRDSQLSVGCQATDTGRGPVAAACDTVVASVRVVG